MITTTIKRLDRAKGFTLVELLVVIAIIGMLASLLMPALQTAKAKAQGAKCVSNLSQIGNAVQQYIADPDNGGKYPSIYHVTTSNAVVGANANAAGGASLLQPLQCLSNYGVTMALLTCPSDRHPDPTYGSYMWSPVIQDEPSQSVQFYGRGGFVFNITKLSKMTVCTDNGMPHNGKINVLRADGHVDTMP